MKHLESFLWTEVKPPQIAFFLVAIGLLCKWLSIGDIPNLPLLVPGTSLFMLGATIMVAAWHQFKKTGNSILPNAETKVLITTGIFSYSRNPMYLGMVFQLGGLGLLLKNSFGIFMPIFMLIVLDKVYIKKEEEKLLDTFQSTYKEYTKTTHKWIGL